MGKSKNEDTFLRKKTGEKQDSATKIISVDGIGNNFSSETEIKKGNFKKYLMNLIEINHPINKTSDNSISSINSFKSHLNIKSFDMFLTVVVVRSTVILLQCLLRGRCEWIRVIWTQLQKKTKQEPSSSAILADSSFNGDSNEDS